MQAQGQLKAGQEEQAAFEQRAAVAEAGGIEQHKAATYQARLLRRQAQAMLSSQLAAYAKSGIVPTVGSARTVQTKTAQKTEEDALVLEREGQLAYGRGANQAGFERKMGRAKRRASTYSALGSILGGTYKMGKEFGW